MEKLPPSPQSDPKYKDFFSAMGRRGAQSRWGEKHTREEKLRQEEDRKRQGELMRLGRIRKTAVIS